MNKIIKDNTIGIILIFLLLLSSCAFLNNKKQLVIELKDNIYTPINRKPITITINSENKINIKTDSTGILRFYLHKSEDTVMTLHINGYFDKKISIKHLKKDTLKIVFNRIPPNDYTIVVPFIMCNDSILYHDNIIHELDSICKLYKTKTDVSITYFNAKSNCVINDSILVKKRTDKLQNICNRLLIGNLVEPFTIDHISIDLLKAEEKDYLIKYINNISKIDTTNTYKENDLYHKLDNYIIIRFTFTW